MSQQEHRLVKMFHVRGIEELGGLIGMDTPVGTVIQIELHRAQFVEEEQLGSRMARAALGSRGVEELLELRQLPEHAGRIPVAVTIHLRDPLAVFVGTPSGIGVDTLDESKLTSRRHRLSSACAPASIAGARKTCS